MPTFLWQGVGPGGKTVKGEMIAADTVAVAAHLRVQRIRPVPDRIREKGSGLSREIKIPGFGGKIKQKDVVIFTRQLAMMIDAGLPIMQALEILVQQTENKTFAGVIGRVKHDV